KGGYGSLVDGHGVLWSARYGSGQTLRYDPLLQQIATPDLTDTSEYGIGIDPVTGKIWKTTYGSGCNLVNLCYPSKAFAASYYATLGSACKGVVISEGGDVWIAYNDSDAGTMVGHLTT